MARATRRRAATLRALAKALLAEAKGTAGEYSVDALRNHARLVHGLADVVEAEAHTFDQDVVRAEAQATAARIRARPERARR